MERRLVLFLVISVVFLIFHGMVMSYLNPPRPKPAADESVAKDNGNDKPDAQPDDSGGRIGDVPGEPDGQEPADPRAEEPAATEVAANGPAAEDEPSEEAADQIVPRRYVTLGSADPGAPYRMLVTLTSQGAAVARTELNSPRYRDIEDRGGYIGHLVLDEVKGARLEGEDGVDVGTPRGVQVQVVGPGTPAAAAGIEVGDLITKVDETPVTRWSDILDILATKRPKGTVKLTVKRSDATLKPTVTLGRRPLEVTRPEGNDPLSLLLTMNQYDRQKLVQEPLDDPDLQSTAVGLELAGWDLWKADWELVDSTADMAKFRRRLPKKGLEIIKTYRLAHIPEPSSDDPEGYKSYHLEFDVVVRNIDTKPHTVAYQLDGPTGLPTEGAWYSNKISRTWSAAGLRDMVVAFGWQEPKMIGTPAIVAQADPEIGKNGSISYVGIDAKYFSAMLLPRKESDEDIWFTYTHPLLVGPKPAEGYEPRANTSCRLIGKPVILEPGQSLTDKFIFFAGPKKPDVLTQYKLDELLYYGWFGSVARVMNAILHFFFWFVGNYGIAILLLTALVRSCMFPLSRKQAQSAQKMQVLQPELKKIKEKYKNNMEAFGKAQQELFRKHGVNPLAGCLPAFIQLPIFLGLYRALMVDIELRQAPLISESVRWCSNLAAPDMLFDWSRFMPQSVVDGVGFLGLGPYFNILPIVTIALFIAQQKLFMPPPTDEQQVMMQKMMKYMMIFMGFMFFKVAAGLCVYFIASSVWGLAERKLLPKPTPADATPQTGTRADAKARAEAERRAAQREREAGAKKKKRGKK